MTRNTVLPLLLSLLWAVSPGAVTADEVSDLIDEALKQYKAGEYSSAAGSLDFAAQKVREKRGEKLQQFLPPPLSGWKELATRSEAVGAALLGGGVTAERKYERLTSVMTVSIVADSPLVQSMMMIFTNPMFAASAGGKMELIAGQKAMVEMSSDNEGKISVMTGNRYLVTVEGENVPKDEIVQYAAAVDYKALAALP